MPDMLVRLYDLPSLDDALAVVAKDGVSVRRAIAPEKPVVVDWVRANFASWVPEVECAFAQVPVRCFIATRDNPILGFACHDVTCLNFFGPEGVAASERGKGTGRALLLATLHAQRAMGYAYSIVGGVGPAAFYEKTVSAIAIEGSTDSVFRGRLRL